MPRAIPATVLRCVTGARVLATYSARLQRWLLDPAPDPHLDLPRASAPTTMACARRPILRRAPRPAITLTRAPPPASARRGVKKRAERRCPRCPRLSRVSEFSRAASRRAVPRPAQSPRGRPRPEDCWRTIRPRKEAVLRGRTYNETRRLIRQGKARSARETSPGTTLTHLQKCHGATSASYKTARLHARQRTEERVP